MDVEISSKSIPTVAASSYCTELFGISNGLVYLPEISKNLGFSSFLANFTTSLKIIKNNEMPCSIFGSNHWFMAHRLLPKTVTSKFVVLVNRLQHQFGIDMQFQSSFSIFFGLSLGFKRPKLYNAATAALDTMVFFSKVSSIPTKEVHFLCFKLQKIKRLNDND